MTATPVAPLTPLGAIDFPDTTGQPTDGSFQVIAGGRTYVWNGFAWRNLGAGGNVSALHNLIDVSDAAKARTAAELGGLLVRQAGKADFDPEAYVLTTALDYGTY